MAYHRYMRGYYKYKGVTKKVTGNVYYRAAYKCNRRWIDRVHLKTLDIKRCTNPEVSAKILDPFVWTMIEESLLKPATLKGHLASWEDEIQSTQIKMEKELRQIAKAEERLKKERAETLDRYATGTLSHEAYIEKCLTYDIESNRLKLKRDEVTKKIPILYKKEIIDANIRFFCESVQARFSRCTTFDERRRFILDFIEEITYTHGKVVLRGSVPLRLQIRENSNRTSEEIEKIDFSIEKEIGSLIMG